MGRNVAHMREKKSAYSVSIGKSKGKRPVGRPRRKWEDSTTKDLREIG
jgi:hypothetical protein